MTAGVPDDRAALVLFSGGQDSTTCLAWALERYKRVETIGFDYGQRHAVELTCRTPIREAMRAMSRQWADRLGADHLLDASTIATIGDTALTSDAAIELDAQGLPTTFVPGRNLLFLVLAGAVAARRDLKILVGGMCETDFSGYPDCRDDAIKAMQLALNLGMDRRFAVETPLMWLDKAATWMLAEALGGQRFVDLIRDGTHTCYLGDHATRHPWGLGCGHCPACALRARGYQRYAAGTAGGPT
ncbi:MAG: 7-cyano-7-deazaguanine synthase QueC [Burkholderiaceae bacterium]